MKKKYKIPCSWQMYGFVEVEAEDWSDAVWQAESDHQPLPEDGEYVMSSFEVDHDMFEFEREEERQTQTQDVPEQEKSLKARIFGGIVSHRVSLSIGYLWFWMHEYKIKRSDVLIERMKSIR